jgi:putative resolvase
MLEKNEEKKNFISISNASLFSGLSPQTLRKMADEKKIRCFKTPGGQRRFDKQSLSQLCHPDLSNENPENVVIPKKNFLYARVSTKKQMDDLSRQIEFLRKPEFIDYVLIQDVASGINFKRKGLQTILDACLQGVIGNVVVAHRDRLCRFGFELIEIIIQKAGGSIQVLDSTGNKSTSNELSEDLMSIIHIYNCREMGKRSYSSRINREKDNKNKTLSNTTTENIT